MSVRPILTTGVASTRPFSERGGCRASRDHVPSDSLGESSRPTVGDISLHREHLYALSIELNLLLEGGADGDKCLAVLREDDGIPVLAIGDPLGMSLTVEIDRHSGDFVLRERMPTTGEDSVDCVLITASLERLIDQIVGLVSGYPGELTPRSLDAAVDILVGRTIAEVERRLVLRTVLYFDGDQNRAAFALGIDEIVLRAKLHKYVIGKFSERSLQEMTL